jgi:hypothetical protein
MIDIILWAATMFAVAYYNIKLSGKLMDASLDRITISHINAEFLAKSYRGNAYGYIMAGIAGLFFPILMHDTYVYTLVLELTKQWYVLEAFIVFNVIAAYHMRQAYKGFIVNTRLDN